MQHSSGAKDEEEEEGEESVECGFGEEVPELRALYLELVLAHQDHKTSTHQQQQQQHQQSLKGFCGLC